MGSYQYQSRSIWMMMRPKDTGNAIKFTQGMKDSTIGFFFQDSTCQRILSSTFPY